MVRRLVRGVLDDSLSMKPDKPYLGEWQDEARPSVLLFFTFLIFDTDDASDT